MALTAALLIVAVAAVLLLRPSDPEQERLAGVPPTDERAIFDSLMAANERRDRVSALLWAERLGRIHPRDHEVLLARGTAWNDYAVEQRPRRVLARSALRTSLERTECLSRAVELVESAARRAPQPAGWLVARDRLGQIYNHLGLPGDALIVYEGIKQRMPNEPGPALRAYWLRALFYDPVSPDTSEYHERMQGVR